MLELHATISGRVQGVGFREAARKCAAQFKLTGYIANLPDGTVEICAHGDRGDLEVFIAQLRQEFASYIESVQLRWRPAKVDYKDFLIRLC